MPRRSLLSIEQRTRLFAIPVDHAEMNGGELVSHRRQHLRIDEIGDRVDVLEADLTVVGRQPPHERAADELVPRVRRAIVAGGKLTRTQPRAAAARHQDPARCEDRLGFSDQRRAAPGGKETDSRDG